MYDDDEGYGATLLRPLSGEQPGQSTVDIGRAIADGDRRRRRTRLAGTGGIAGITVAVVAAGAVVAGFPHHDTPRRAGPASVPAASTTGPARPGAPAPPTSCTMQRLPLPAGEPPTSVVIGADPTGRYIVGRSYPFNDGSRQVLIWDRGQVRKVSMAGYDQELRDVTSSGTAVGTSYLSATSGPTAAWMYRNGVTSRLAGTDAGANAINESGVIVGSVNGRPARWASATSEPTMLALPGPGFTGYAAGIDEDGTIVGQLQASISAEPFGYLWRPDGTLVELPTPTVDGHPVRLFTARSIRAGWVVGPAAWDQGRARYIGHARWNLRTGEVSATLRGMTAEAVNRYGWTAGTLGAQAVLAAGDRTVPLPDLGQILGLGGMAYTISDDASTVAGQVTLDAETVVAVVWHCH